jgi:hypothetical protein
MAGQAEVGALRVRLSMDAGEFEEGTKDAGDALNKFATRIGITAGVAAAASEKIIEYIEKAMNAVIDGLKAGIDRATAFADAADDLGLSIETVAGIATQSRVGVDELSKAIKELNASMVDVASGDATSKAARSFAALGVAVTDVNGQLRPTGDVLNDIADKFATYRDGTQKAALATNVFGQSGDALLDVLNGGAEGIEEFKNKAEDAGIVFDKQLGEAAQNLRENIRELGSGFEIFSNKLATLTLPVIDKLVQKLADTAEGSTLSADLAELMAAAFNNTVAAAHRTIAVIERLSAEFTAYVYNVKSLVTGAWSEIEERNRITAARIEKINGDLNYELQQLFARTHEEQVKAADEHQDKVAAPIIASLQSITEAQREWNKSVADGVALADKIRTPNEILTKSLYNLGDAYDAGKISAERLANAQFAAAMVAQNAYAGMAGNIAGSLEKVFAGSKGVAIASALINTYEAATKALATYPPPFNYVAAAATVAAGMVQVANIRKTTKDGGGGGGGGGGGAAAAPAGPTSVPQSLIVQGLSPGQLLSSEYVKDLAGHLLQAQRDGVQVVLA